MAHPFVSLVLQAKFCCLTDLSRLFCTKLCFVSAKKGSKALAHQRGAPGASCARLPNVARVLHLVSHCQCGATLPLVSLVHFAGASGPHLLFHCGLSDHARFQSPQPT